MYKTNNDLTNLFRLCTAFVDYVTKTRYEYITPSDFYDGISSDGWLQIEYLELNDGDIVVELFYNIDNGKIEARTQNETFTAYLSVSEMCEIVEDYELEKLAETMVID